MMHRAQRSIATLVAILSLLVTAALTTPAAAQDSGGNVAGDKVSGGKDSGDNDLRDIHLGMPATDLPDAGYVNLACATDPQKTLDGLDRLARLPCRSFRISRDQVRL